MNYFSNITKDELKENVETFLSNQGVCLDYSRPIMHKKIKNDITNSDSLTAEAFYQFTGPEIDELLENFNLEDILNNLKLKE